MINNIEKFNPFDFTSNVIKMLYESKIEDAKNLVDSTVSNNFLEESNYRVKNARNIIKSIEQHLLDVEVLVNSHDKYETIKIVKSKLTVNKGIPPKLDRNTPKGVYVNHVNNFIREEINLKYIILGDSFSKEDISKFGFLNKLNTIEVDKMYVENDITFSALGSGAMTCFNRDGEYHPSRSGRVAKASSINVYFDSKEHKIESAYILPFPHTANNYYHCLSEIGYGFRHINRVDNKIPIIYGEDKFGIVSFFAESLGIDKSRLINVKNLKGFLIEKAYLPGVGPFYWSSNMVDFFRYIGSYYNIQGKPNSFSKIYISRLNSSRSPIYEKQLEEDLKDLGFFIVRAEDMNIDEQVRCFMNADIIVAHHGAGLSNMAFSKTNVKVYEILNKEMPAPDFSHRAKSVTSRYYPVFGVDSTNYKKLIDLIID